MILILLLLLFAGSASAEVPTCSSLQSLASGACGASNGAFVRNQSSVDFYYRGDGLTWSLAAPPVDRDGDGRYDESPVMDWDGDGSTWTYCTAKDTPDSACKVAGEWIYRDFADDIGCGIRGCNGAEPALEHNAEVYLTPGAYLNFPCWRPGGTNDPTDPLTRDSQSDAARDDCPLGENGMRRSQVSLAGWAGTIKGLGPTSRPTDTTALGTDGGRTDVAYIVDDRGNNLDPYLVDGTENTAPTSFHKTFGFGYALQASAVVKYGHGAWTGTGGGWGAIQADGGSEESILDNAANICVCINSSGGCTTSAGDSTTGSQSFDIQSATTETNLLIEHDVSTTSTRSATAIVSPTSDGPYSQGGCDSANEVEVTVGLQTDGMTNDADTRSTTGVLPAMLESLQDSKGFMYILRDDYFASAAQIREVVFEPQDWYNEPGGDCSQQGIFDEDNEPADNDCDENPMVAVHGFNGRTAIKDSAFRYWHHYSVDGEVMTYAAVPTLEGNVWRWGNGNPIADPGYGWWLSKSLVRDSYFGDDNNEGFVIANFSNALRVTDFVIQNSVFNGLMNLSNQNDHVWDRIRIESSEFSYALGVTCGSKNNRVNELISTGRMHKPSEAGSTLGLFTLSCDTETEPLDGLWITNSYEQAPGSSLQAGAVYDAGGSQAFMRIRISDTDEAQNIKNVFLINNAIRNTVISDDFSGTTGYDEGRGGACLVGIEDRTAAGGSGTDGLLGSDGTGGTGGELDTLRNIHMIGNLVDSGALFCQFASGGFFDYVDGDPSCSDKFDTGSPQTTGVPDGLCDSDGSTAVTWGNTTDSPLFDAHYSSMRSLNIENTPF